MREEKRFLTAAGFISLLNNYFFLSSQYYEPDYLLSVVVPRLSSVQERVLRICGFSYGLIALGLYDKAYLAQLAGAVNDFVCGCEEVLSSSLSDEGKFSEFEDRLNSFELRLASMEDEIMKSYIIKTLEGYLEKHRPVLGKDFTVKDLFRVLKRIVDDDECEIW